MKKGFFYFSMFFCALFCTKSFSQLRSYSAPATGIGGTNNTVVGVSCGSNLVTGAGEAATGTGPGTAENNTFMGYFSGLATQVGDGNSFYGVMSGYGNTTGSYNTYLGQGSGYLNNQGNNNTFTGWEAGYRSKGSNNVYLGYRTGRGDYSVGSGSGNVFIGAGVGMSAFGDQSNLFLVDNQDTASPLIQGNFADKTLSFTVNLNANSKVEIFGQANKSGLKFNQLKSTTTTLAPSNGKVLTVDESGFVVLTTDLNATPGSNAWNLTGNSATTPETNFLGTIDDKNLVFKKNNKVAGLLSSSTTVFGAVAGDAQRKDSFSSLRNTYIGANAAYQFTTQAEDNTIVGAETASTSVSAGKRNTIIGSQAGHNSISTNGALGSLDNTYIGYKSGVDNYVGHHNTFIGTNSGVGNNGSYNTFVGSVTGTSTSSTIILADGAGNQRLYIDPNGNVGIGLGNNTAAQNKLEIKGPINNTSGLRFAVLKSNFIPTSTNTKFLTVDAAGDVVLENVAATNTDSSIYANDGHITSNRTVALDGNQLVFNTDLNGRVFIGNSGTAYPADFTATFPSILATNYKLLVSGGILTEKVKIAIKDAADWKDGVFANDYELMKLSDIESFVKDNKHLPGIESADELVKNGLDLSDMQAKQMGKIEELTLYVIEQNKTLERQNKEIEALKAQMKILIDRK